MVHTQILSWDVAVAKEHYQLSDRITREVTPFVEVLAATQADRTRLIQRFTDGAAIFEEDGRMVLHQPSRGGHFKRILLDPDADIYSLAITPQPDLLSGSFETHLPEVPEGDLPRALHGRTLVVPHQGIMAPTSSDANFAVSVLAEARHVPANASEIHMDLSACTDLPDIWPEAPPPICAIVRLGRDASSDLLSQVMLAMGTGRVPVRELRVRIDPRQFQVKNRRSPFLSEVVELITAASGVSVVSLSRELALRRRLLELGMRRHLIPDPYFVTWLFRGNRSRGLVSATDNFPIPRRASRREILRGTPDSEHGRLQEYLSLMEDTKPRLQALAERDLYAVSVHFLPNPDLPLMPNHGGITQMINDELAPLS